MEMRLADPRRIRHGGPGYSVPGWPDGRDDEDREFLQAASGEERQRLAEEK